MSLSPSSPTAEPLDKSETDSPKKRRKVSSKQQSTIQQDLSSGDFPTFLSVRQLAELLHINEKKVYQLASEGDLPGTKVTGKWIFPTRLVEDWINENCHGGALTDSLVISGSDDLLMERICRELAYEYQDTAMLGYSPCGTLHGLRLLDNHRTDACLINWGLSDQAAVRHPGLLRGFKNHKRWVAVRLMQRRMGFAMSPATHLSLQGKDAFQKKSYEQNSTQSSAAQMVLQETRLRWAQRHELCGTQRLLKDLCAAQRLDPANYQTSLIADGERSAIAAVARGLADVTLASDVAARESNLHFVTVGQITLDLVMNKNTYFRSIIQQLLTHTMRSSANASFEIAKGYSHFEAQQLISLGQYPG